jgi:hypothetical protein
MKLREWALAAEVVSGIAVIVTLIVLIIEVRTSTDVARVAAYQQVTRDFDDWRSLILSDPQLVEIMIDIFQRNPHQRGIDPEADLRRLFVVQNQWSGNERAHIAYRGGIIDERDWGRIRRALCAEVDQIPEDLREQVIFRLTDEFVQFLENECMP